MSIEDREHSIRASSIPKPLGECVLWFAATQWDDLARSDRRLVEAFDQPVVWVDSSHSPLRRGGRWLPAKWGGMQLLRSDPVLVRVTTASLPLSTRWGVRSARAPLKLRQVRGALHALGATPHTVVLSYLDDLFGVWGDDAVEVLRVSDDYVAGAGLMGISARWLVRLEESAVRKADVVCTASEELAVKWQELGAETHLLPNGCIPVPEHYLDSSNLQTRANPRNPSPIVGLVGHLSSRIDMSVLEEISNSGCRLLLIGPKDPRWEPERFAGLTSRESVEYLGRLPAASIPFYLRQMDVGITPYADSEFNRASFPLKTLEYLGAGLPVVTSNLPASQWLRNDMVNYLAEEAVEQHLVIANSVRDFVNGVQRLSNMRSEELDRERWRFASMHSWSNRAATLRSIVDLTRASGPRPGTIVCGR